MSSNSVRRIGTVIIGGGHAGGRTAERLRAFGFDGSITVVGHEPHLPYERPPLSKSALINPELPEPALLLGDDEWAERAVTLLTNEKCCGIDLHRRCVRLASGTRLDYSHLVLATGLTPRRLPQLDVVTQQTAYLHSYNDAIALRKKLLPQAKVLIVGAGFIGLEVAASARHAGATVTVVEALPRPLSRVFDESLSDWFTQLHQQNSVEILCGHAIKSIVSGDNLAQVTLDNGKRIDADLIVSGIGGIPLDHLARNAGLAVDNGVVVDRHCRTRATNVYAVGDIANMYDERIGRSQRLESWKYAEDTAAIAARNICGEPAQYNQVPWFWTDQYQYNIQVVGTLSESATVFARGALGDARYLAYYLDGEALRGAVGLDCGGDIRRARGSIEADRPITARVLSRLGLEPVSPVAAFGT